MFRALRILILGLATSQGVFCAEEPRSQFCRQRALKCLKCGLDLGVSETRGTFFGFFCVNPRLVVGQPHPDVEYSWPGDDQRRRAVPTVR